MSNREGFSARWKDFAGSDHPSCTGSEAADQKTGNFSGVTSLYVVLEGENFLRFADPWLPRGANEKSIPLFVDDKKIEMPSDFHFKRGDVSNSKIAILGKNSAGEWAIWTGLFDFDTTKMNPFLKNRKLSEIESRYSERHPIKPDRRFYPDDYDDLSADQRWTRISFEGLEDKNVDFERFTILQTGPGNDAQELRLGSADEGAQGYYWKSLQEDAPWEWRSTAV